MRFIKRLLTLPLLFLATGAFAGVFTSGSSSSGGASAAGTTGALQYYLNATLAGSTYWYLIPNGKLQYDAERTYTAEDIYSDSALNIKADRAINLDTQGTGGVSGGKIIWRNCPFGTTCSDAVMAYWSEQGTFGGGSSLVFDDGSSNHIAEFSGNGKRFYAPSAFAIGVTTTALTSGATISASGVDTNVKVDASAGAFNVVLPRLSNLASPRQAGRVLIIQKVDASTQPVTILKNGSDAATAGAEITRLQMEKQTVILQAEDVGVNYTWRVVGGINVDKYEAGVYNSSFTTTSGSGVNVSSFSFSMGPNQKWVYDIWLQNGCDNTGGNKFALVFPTGAVTRAQIKGMGATTTSIKAERMDTSTTLSSAFNAQTNSNGWTEIKGTIQTSTTAGDLVLQAASTTGGQTTAIHIGSWIKAERLP
jgi:hypothetical protein